MNPVPVFGNYCPVTSKPSSLFHNLDLVEGTLLTLLKATQLVEDFAEIWQSLCLTNIAHFFNDHQRPQDMTVITNKATDLHLYNHIIYDSQLK